MEVVVGRQSLFVRSGLTVQQKLSMRSCLMLPAAYCDQITQVPFAKRLSRLAYEIIKILF